MIERYRGRAAQACFGEDATLQRWTEWTRGFAVSAAYAADDKEAALSLAQMVYKPAVYHVTEAEKEYGHDVVAFLSLIEAGLPAHARRYLHYGLTSSDIVDNALVDSMYRFDQAFAQQLVRLMQALYQWEGKGEPRLGRTHGQVAEPTSVGNHAAYWNGVLTQLGYTYDNRVYRFKTPGATGKSRFRTRDEVTRLLRDQGVPADRSRVLPSTQVIHRDFMVEWASTLVRAINLCESIALDLRLASRSEVFEFMEGGAVRRVGSSSMPHKKNPVGCETVTGLARLARGYYVSLLENCALHDDRDISNSAVERVALRDLAHVAENVVTKMTKIVSEGKWLTSNVRNNLARALPEATSSWMMSLLQHHAEVGPVEAGKIFREAIDEGNPDMWRDQVMHWIGDNRSAEAATSFSEDYHDLVQKHLGMDPWWR